MKPASSKTGKALRPAKKQVAEKRANMDATRIKALEADQTKNRATAAQSSRLIEESQEQQEMLKLQNEQLSEAQAGLELGRQRYAELYNNAPVGYLTLDGRGCIREMNQTAGELLGRSPAHLIGRSPAHLIGRPLLPHFAAADRKAFLKHLWEGRRSSSQVITTLRLAAKDGAVRNVQFATSHSHQLGDRPSWCRTAMLDVTAQHDAEEALRVSEARFRLLAENMGEVFWFMDLDPLGVSYVSPAYEQIYGASVTELYHNPMAWQNAIHPEDLPGVNTAFERWIKGEVATFNAEYRVINRQGDVRWIADRGIVVKRKDGVPHQISGIATDITERKQAEAERQRSEEKFRSLLEAAPDAMTIVDDHGIVQLVNAQTLKLFGYTREELVGQSMDILVPERFREHHPALRASYAAAPQPRSMGARRDLFALRKDGSEFPIEVSLSPLQTEEGLLIISAVRDITERKRAEQELREAQRFAQSTLEAVPASLAVLDETGTIISTNKTWIEFAEANGALPGAVAPGVNYLAMCDAAGGEGAAEAARFAEGIREVMSGARSRFSMEYPCHGAELQRWFVGYVTAFSGDGRRRVVIAHVDISERKRAEQVIRRLNMELETRVEERTAELRRTNEELRHQIARRRRLEEEILEISESEQQRIGQDLHDDLGQQLAGISCLSRVLETNLTAQKSPEAELAAKITSLLKNALGLTRSLARGLHPVALQSGGLMTALDELTQRISEMFSVTCRCKCPPVPHMDNTIATHLYRIAQEAVTNAVKHGHAQEIEIELSFNAHQTILSVKDDGAGLPAPDPNRTGMGLRIMTYRADMIGGALGIQSDQSSGGTIVTCTIPTPRHEPSTDPSYAKKPSKTAGTAAQNKSLRRR